ncbi:MAG TPA: hypothetical protein DCX54_00100 [Flavobacteriales bacterium]|nr:hypothetical protein [Flavobacteriales bacterium]
MEKHKVILIEDDENLGYLLKESLEIHEFNVRWFTNGLKAWESFESASYDLCLIDVILPGMDGLEIASHINKSHSKLPIIFISARSLKSDIIAGYASGCVDYIVKPFEIYELILKSKAILSNLNKEIQKPDRYYHRANLKLDTSLQLCFIGEENQKVNRIETEILKILLSAEGEVVTRNYILEKIWERNDMYTSKSLDTYLSKIRKLLLPSELSLKNIYGLGYVLEITDEN